MFVKLVNKLIVTLSAFKIYLVRQVSGIMTTHSGVTSSVQLIISKLENDKSKNPQVMQTFFPRKRSCSSLTAQNSSLKTSEISIYKTRAVFSLGVSDISVLCYNFISIVTVFQCR